MSTDIEQHQGAALAVRADQTEWTPVQRAALAHMGIEDAPEADQRVFLHHCQRTGLDPFAKQVYMIGRSGDVKRKDDQGRTITERGTIYTIQTGIDGYRLIGNRAARLFNDEVEHLDPVWRGRPGTNYDRWLDYWPDGAGNPIAARYVLVVNGHRHVATCNFSEYAQYSGKGELTSMWKKMPANQLAKCAEAAAWRKAYPADFSGIGMDGDPHHTVIDAETGQVVVSERPSQRPGPGSGVAQLEAHLGASHSGAKPEPSQVIDAEPEPTPAPAKAAKAKPAKAAPPPAEPAAPGSLSRAQRESIVKGLDVLFEGAKGRAEFVRAAVKRDVDDLGQLTGDEADDLLVFIAEATASDGGEPPADDDAKFAH